MIIRTVQLGFMIGSDIQALFFVLNVTRNKYGVGLFILTQLKSAQTTRSVFFIFLVLSNAITKVLGLMLARRINCVGNLKGLIYTGLLILLSCITCLKPCLGNSILGIPLQL